MLHSSTHLHTAIPNSVTHTLRATLNQDGVVQALNAAGATYLGYTIKELAGQSIVHLFHKDDHHLLEQEFETALCHPERQIHQEFRLQKRDGSTVVMQVTIEQLQGFDNQTMTLLLLCTAVATAQEISPPDAQVDYSFLITMLDQLPIAVFVKDGREEHFGEILFWNKTCELMFGLTANEVIGKNIYDYVPQEQGDFFYQKDREAFARGCAEDIPAEPIDSRTLGRRILHTIKTPIYDKNKAPQYLLCISEDITERKLAEDSLQQQAERDQLVAAIAHHIRQSLNLKQVLTTTVTEVRQFLQTDRVLIFRFEADWSGTVMVESVGPEWKSLLGEVIEDPCFANSYVPHYQQGRTRAISNIATDGLVPCYVEMLAQHQVQAILVVPIMQSDQLWGLLIAHHCRAPRDWQPFETELLSQLASQASIAIQQSELYQQVQSLNVDLERQVQMRTAQLQLAFDFEATLKRITDRVRDSLDEDHILQAAVEELAIATSVTGCNAALYNLKQRTSTVRYEYTASVVPFRGRIVQMDNFLEGYNQLLQGQYFQFCSLIPHPQRGRVVLLACPILDDQGVLGDLWLINQSYHVFSEQDIRLVQQVANQCAIALRQAELYQTSQAQVEELEKLNRLKDDFLSTVSHELRTPMANIKLAAQMLEIMIGQANLTEFGSLKRYLKILHDECQREISLINDLLDLSRLETDSKPLTFTTIALQDWVPRLAVAFTERAQNQQQHLQISIPPGLPPIVTSTYYLERIVTELLNNACKYTPATGHITVTAAIESAKLRLQISNSGVEISPDELTRVFDKFYRIPKNDPWRHGGTGLGLALVKRLVESLGGIIYATSNLGQTCFTIELSIVPESGE